MQLPDNFVQAETGSGRLDSGVWRLKAYVAVRMKSAVCVEKWLEKDAMALLIATGKTKGPARAAT